MNDRYRPAIDALLRGPITPADMARTDEILEQAGNRSTSVKKVKADIACNQMTWDYKPCDWHTTIEARPSRAQRDARIAVWHHLKDAHKSLGNDRINSLVAQTIFTMGDFGG